MNSLARAATVLGVLALGSAALAGTAAAAPVSFEVCSPLGCAAQSVRGTVDRGEVLATLTDNSRVSTLVAQFIAYPPPQTTIAEVDDGVFEVVAWVSSDWKQLTVKACAGFFDCNSKTIIRL
ncbi:hypothetical protein ACIBCH_05295 [Amycolatopsis thailandensis]|uniref:hypothetical protein n=1 Tax=Amycolatopsis thailandensis TaxID=589330 RepID=UPI0037930329